MRIVRATSVEVLADGLARRLATEPPADPMAPIRVAVPSRGMDRWLSQRLSHHLGATDDQAGICANLDVVFPLSIIQRAIAAVLGDDADTPDPWAPDRLVWPLLDHLDELPDDASHAPLLAHLADGDERATRRRFPLARRIADLFDRYAMYRPDMVDGWSRGQDLDADGRHLPANRAWQPILWRALRDRVAVPSPDERFRAAVDALASDTIARPDDLPDDVTIFGVLGLPPLQLALLDALSRHVPVTIHAIAPVPAWTPGVPVTEVAHPLLASCGMAARDAHNALVPHEPGADDAVASAGDAQRDDATTALAVLQADIRADRVRGGADGAAPHPLAQGDASIQAHACHGPMRQLEVLREVLLGLLEEDHTLEPRDIVVITPDITTWDPLIRAVFSDGDRPGDRPRAGDGGDDEDDGASGVPTLPYRVADRAVTEDNAVAQALLTVLELVTDRVGASAVLDLLARAPVRDRFGLSATDLADLPAWVLGTGISWGIDADHRQQLIDLDDASHTWQAGLDRLVLGSAMPDDGTRMVAGVVPYDDVEGGAVELLGKLTGATEALFTSLRSLRDPRAVDDWRQALEEVIDALLDPGPQRDGELTAQLAAVRQALADMVDDSQRADGTPSPTVLTLEEVRSLVASKLGRGGGRTTYGTGAITFAGLVPLRNVPFRVVCLVGMDDGAIPRSGMRHGFDLVASDPRPGDPDPRVEDRQLLLDAILSAGDHLVLTWTGNDPRTNEVQQPAVPISELLDVLADSLAVEAADNDGALRDAVWKRLVTSHPLQPHSARYFRDPLDGEAPVPRAFDRRQLAAARTAAGDRTPAAAFFPDELPPPTEEEVDPVVVDLGDLVRFLENPVKHLLLRRVGIALGDDDPRLEDRDPTELDGLDRWRLGQDLLDLQRADTSPNRWRELVMATGTVPVGGLGEVALDGIQDLTRKLAERIRQVPGEDRSVAIDVTVPVPDQAAPRRVVGSVDMRGTTVLNVTVSKDRKKRRLPVWVGLLAATVAGEDRPEGLLLMRHAKDDTQIDEATLHPVADLLAELHSVTVGGGDDGDGASHEILNEVIGGATAGTDAADAVDVARRLLGDLVALYVHGMVAPVRVLPETGCAYATGILDGGDPTTALRAARTAWENTWNRMGECFDTYVCQAFGPEPALDMLAADGTFQRDAVRLWRPIAIAERGPAEVVS